MDKLKKVLKLIYGTLPYLLIISFGIAVYHYVSISITQNLNYYTSIISGIISGIVTALILFIVQIIWKKNVLVWIENLLYQDVCIEGEWSGLLVPFMGLEDLDKITQEIAWKRFKEMHKEARNSKKLEETEEVEASIYNEKTGKEEKISAEVVLSGVDDNDTKTKESVNSGKKTISVNLTSVPIIVKFEIKRVGHQITGKMIEIGGASQVCSYLITGSFKNLILSGCYETTSKDNIDRGALSLMLFDNGKKLEGFFSSYSDGRHKVVPMQCILRKRNQLAENDD